MTDMNPAKFLQEVRQEVSRVTWPTRKETLVSSVMVLVMVLIAAIFFYIVDSIIGKIVSLILGFGGQQ